MRHKATFAEYKLLEVPSNILDLPFIDFSKLPYKYGEGNFIGVMYYDGISLMSWQDFVACWDGEVRFYFDGQCYDKIDNFTHIIVKDKFDSEDIYDYLSNFVK